MFAFCLFNVTPAAARQGIDYGDVNNDGLIDATDALYVLQVAVGKAVFSDNTEAAAADVTGDYLSGDGYLLDALDALFILQYAVGKTIDFLVYAMDPLAPAPQPSMKADGVLQAGQEVDFVLEFPAGQDIKILQLSDMQSTLLTEGEVCRNKNYQAPYLTDIDRLLWRYVEEAVTSVQPDLILLAGDNVQGIFDDSGEDWQAMCNHMDTYGIPWLITFGNHDRESQVGTDFQIDCLLNSRHCIFAKGSVSGQSNYTVAIKQGQQYKAVLWMLDTHGSEEKWLKGNPNRAEILSAKGVKTDQLLWIRDTAATIRYDLGQTVPSLMFMHIAPQPVAAAVKARYPGDYRVFPFTPWLPGDFGVATEIVGGVGSELLLPVAKTAGCTGMFFGHQHRIAYSIMVDTIRMTWGLKTGCYAYRHDGLNGALLITLQEETDQFKVQYLYSQIFS